MVALLVLETGLFWLFLNPDAYVFFPLFIDSINPFCKQGISLSYCLRRMTAAAKPQAGS